MAKNLYVKDPSGGLVLRDGVSALFSVSIELLRHRSGLTQEQVAASLGVTPTTYCRMESGKAVSIKFSQLDSLARLFQVDPFVLFDYTSVKGRRVK